ncbi:MAG: hypothetical protein HC923_01240 [Myxococcales bacterium]|nr:hypothetical protein [Myxococcales bacterium]
MLRFKDEILAATNGSTDQGPPFAVSGASLALLVGLIIGLDNWSCASVSPRGTKYRRQPSLHETTSPRHGQCSRCHRLLVIRGTSASSEATAEAIREVVGDRWSVEVKREERAGDSTPKLRLEARYEGHENRCEARGGSGKVIPEQGR